MSGFGFDEFVLEDGVYAAAAGAFVQFGAQLGKGLGGAGGDHFDLTRVIVADPAVKAEFSGLAMDEPAEAYALYTAANQEMDHHTERVSQSAPDRSKIPGFPAMGA